MNAITLPARLFRRNGSGENNTIWALKDVSFEVQKGEVLGIIGRNGAGKTTLLKILSRVTEPTEGEVRIRGRVGSLLEVGTGFHPELTGRENIFLNGAILGMRKEEIKKKFDEIVAFAEIEKFLDTPVKRYSSGMYVRLAFAVAAHLEPEILLVDEVLAVGDAAFQKKCLGKMGDVSKEGRTVLFVSHNMTAVQNLCQKALWINKGQNYKMGSADIVINEYINNSVVASTERGWNEKSSAPGSDEIRIKRIYVRPISSDMNELMSNDKDIQIGIDFWSLKNDQNLAITLHIITNDGVVAFSTSTIHQIELRKKRLDEGLYGCHCLIPSNFLNSNVYIVRLLVVKDHTKVVFKMDDALVFEIVESGKHRGAYFGERPGVVAPIFFWELMPIVAINT